MAELVGIGGRFGGKRCLIMDGRLPDVDANLMQASHARLVSILPYRSVLVRDSGSQFCEFFLEALLIYVYQVARKQRSEVRFLKLGFSNLRSLVFDYAIDAQLCLRKDSLITPPISIR
jgi:hypothetical protein